jgi:hypothetical protein
MVSGIIAAGLSGTLTEEIPADTTTLYLVYFAYTVSVIIFFHSAFFVLNYFLKKEGKKFGKRSLN